MALWSVKDVDPSSKLGEVYEWPAAAGLTALNTAELVAGRSGLGSVPERRGALAQVRAAQDFPMPWVVSWGNIGMPAAPKITLQDNREVQRSIGAAYLEVEWGVRSALHKARVDWGGGGQLQVCGVTVRTTVVLPNRVPEGGVIPDNGDGGQVWYEPNNYHCSIVPGTLGPHGPLYRTVCLGLITSPAGEAFCAIPQYAKRVQIHGLGVNAAADSAVWQLGFFNGGDPAGGVAPVQVQRNTLVAAAYQSVHWERTAWIPVPADAVYFRAAVTGGGNNFAARAIFELAL